MSSLVTAHYTAQADLDYPEIEMTTPDFMHSNESEQNEDVEEVYSRVRLVLVWVLALMIIVLNSLVIGILIGSSKRHSRMYFFLFNLAIADLCVGIFDVVVDGLLELSEGMWMLGESLCKIHMFFKDFVLYASIYILAVMSIDRALIVSKPLQRLQNGRRLRWTAVLTSWGLSAVLSIPSAILHKISDHGDVQFCHIQFEDPKWWKILFMATFSSVFLIPVIIIVSSYTILIFVLCRRNADLRLKETRNSAKLSNRTLRQTNSVIFNRGISRSKFKSIQLSLGIVSGFIICWSPYFIYNLLEVFEVVKPHPMKIPIMILAYLNNVANPIIFFIYHHTLETRRERATSLETTLINSSSSSAIRLQKLTEEKFC
ncbi:hypothetical protein CHS0354_025581 [Potamilus streckersoni]|uniref:G-protein coupled receptors family 1 profile domain-containing protein n=1 Tax=Potamilus streckersoni TaxID=2493646 RepID=A0AAE0S1D7_9BIVA|nr:hypothetical protein CHS0354_025581 [Potamilus streckersoni]